MTNSNVTSKPPVTLRLVFPRSQCGSLIGKGGSKIKEIREALRSGGRRHAAGLYREGCHNLWHSTGHHSVCKTICSVMLESPPKGATIPYRPKGIPAGAHAVLAQQHPAQAFAFPGQYAFAHQDLTKLHQLAMQHIPLPSLGQSNPTFPGYDASGLTIIGCIIGRQGSKINEIRQVSGAHIKIASATDGSAMRQVTITGSPASISVAHLINARPLPLQPPLTNMSFSQSVPSNAATSMAVLAANTQAPINVHSPSTLQALQNQHYAVPVSSLLGMKTLLAVHPAAASSLAQGLCPYTAKMTTAGMKKSDRQKFAPY
ncbi:hypothetical protein KUCAC02_024207 [Chaenocephalus aceratus]|uniref:Uncharacterized protein n=1 Tax=Chaenocephalus aceratus TaxID=36190 RepID=A0ACB9WIY7_CHAAC|nr:hypothetical protein KUCAC02_024207 [Chaenocephalus aceratus]